MDNYIVQPGQSQAVQQEAHDATQAERSAPRWGESARMTGGVSRITVTGGQEQITSEPNVKQGEWGQLTENDGAAGILGSARSSSGRAVAGADIRPDSLVRIGNMETTVQAAIAGGFLVRHADGSFSEPGAGPSSGAPQRSTQQDQRQPQQARNDQQQQQGDEPVSKVADLPAEHHALASDICARVDNVTLTGAVTSLCDGEELSEHLVTQASGQLGLTADEVRSRAGQLRTAYTQQAHTMVGPNAQAIFDYANQHEPKLLKEAVSRHVQHEDGRAYEPLVKSFWLNLDRTNPDAIMTARNAAQLRPMKDRSGNITVQGPDMPSRMSWRAAVTAGFINPRK